MTKTIRLNKRTELSFLFPHFDKTSNRISISADCSFLFQFYRCYKYYHSKEQKSNLNNFYNIDFEISILGFGIAVETIINKKKLDVIVGAAKIYFNKLKRLAH